MSPHPLTYVHRRVYNSYMEKHTTTGGTTMKESERVFRLTRRDGITYWSGPYDHADQFSVGVLPEEEVRHLSIADAFDAAEGGRAMAADQPCDYAEMYDDEQECTVNAAHALADLLLTMAPDPRDTAQEEAYANAARVLHTICDDGAHDALAEDLAPLLSHPTILEMRGTA